MENNWIEYDKIKLENGVFYELYFYKPPIKYEDGSVIEGSSYHQEIRKYEEGFKDNAGYWLKPTPTHVRKIELTIPPLS